MIKQRFLQTGNPRGTFSLGDKHPIEEFYFHRYGLGDCERWTDDLESIKKQSEGKRENRLASRKRWREKNKGYMKDYLKDWREKNPDHGKKWRKENPKKQKDIQKRSYEKNKATHHARVKARKESQRSFYQNLSQEHKKQIADFYLLRDELNLLARSCGAGIFEVDHIFPLRHKYFCGLHAPWNLQILPKRENRAKTNSIPTQIR